MTNAETPWAIELRNGNECSIFSATGKPIAIDIDREIAKIIVEAVNKLRKTQ